MYIMMGPTKLGFVSEVESDKSVFQISFPLTSKECQVAMGKAELSPSPDDRLPWWTPTELFQVLTVIFKI
jgi:hypothetical protein